MQRMSPAMLIITTALFALLLQSSAAPVELASQEHHTAANPTRIALSKRLTLTAGGDGVVDLAALSRHRAARSA